MRVLTVDVGSSSIKAAWCKNGNIKTSMQVDTPSVRAGRQVEMDGEQLIAAFEKVISEVMKHHKHVDAIAIDTLSPGMGLVDGKGGLLTGLITHQDRRSFKQAQQIEEHFGVAEHQKLIGNRPIPGGIGSTSLLWLKENCAPLWKKRGWMVGPATLLVHHLTGQWCMDVSHAGFTGLYATPTLGGWAPAMLKFLGITEDQLPRLLWADEIAGTVKAGVAARLGITAGTPVLPGIVDTSAALISTDCHPGQMVHSSGSSDVLALVVDGWQCNDAVLWRPLGTGRHAPARWLAVSTIAAGGSSIKWVRDQFFSEMSHKQFGKMMEKLIASLGGKKTRKNGRDDKGGADSAEGAPGEGVEFRPLLAGDRTSMEEKQAAFEGLTLSTTREEMLRAVIRALGAESRRRFNDLQKIRKVNAEIYTMGGEEALANFLHSEWIRPGSWKFTRLAGEAMPGLAKLAELALGKCCG